MIATMTQAVTITNHAKPRLSHDSGTREDTQLPINIPTNAATRNPRVSDQSIRAVLRCPRNPEAELMVMIASDEPPAFRPESS